MPTTSARDRSSRPQHRPTLDALAAVRSLGRRRVGRHVDPTTSRLATDLERHDYSLTDLLNESSAPGVIR